MSITHEVSKLTAMIDITEILMKVALNTINQNLSQKVYNLPLQIQCIMNKTRFLIIKKIFYIWPNYAITHKFTEHMSELYSIFGHSWNIFDSGKSELVILFIR